MTAISTPSLQMTTHTFPSHDGAELFYRAWLPFNQAKQAIVIMNRGQEHSVRIV